MYLHFSHLLWHIWALNEVLTLWCRDTVSPALWIWAALQEVLNHEVLIQSLHCHFKPVKETKCTTCHIGNMHRECVYESICFPAWKPDGLLIVSCFLAETCPFWSGWSWWCPQPLLMTIQPQPCWQQLSWCMELMAADISTLLCQRPGTWCSGWGLMAAPDSCQQFHWYLEAALTALSRRDQSEKTRGSSEENELLQLSALENEATQNYLFNLFVYL